MWKYVSRRIKDAYEKTHNVLDVRKTWTTCGEKRPDSSSSKALVKYNCFYYVNRQESNSGSSSSSKREGFKKDHQYGRMHNTWLGALTWSSAIICGWYASQLLCLNRRHLGWDSNIRCFPSKLLLQSSQTIHSNVLSHRAYTAPDIHSQPQQQLHQDHYLDESFPSEKYIYEISNDHETLKNEPQPQPEKTPTVDAAFENLMKVLGEIEFQMGVQNLVVGDYRTAVSHLKLGTSHHHAGATFNLGLCYEQGFGVGKDTRMAMECYQIAASLGHPEAMYNLGVYYARGLGGLRKNRFEAKRYFLAAADLGQREAKLALGLAPQQPPAEPSKSPQQSKNSIALEKPKFNMASGASYFKGGSVQLHQVAIK